MNARSAFALKLILALAFSSPSAMPQTPPGMLQDLIDAARPGDTVFVPPGIISGDFRLTKRMVLKGEPGAVLRGSGRGTCLTVTADSCVITDLVVEHTGRDLTREDAAILLESDHNVLSNLTVRDALFGIYLLESHHNQIIRNSIIGCPDLELGQRGDGIHIWNSDYNTFIQNSITGTRDGFYFQYANHTHTEGNRVFNLRYGLHYMYADTNEFIGNTFYDNVAGAAIMYSTDIRFRHNVFVDNRGYASYGLLFQDCHEVVADSNVISDNVVGMFFEAATDNVFRHNVIARNDVALKIFQSSDKNVFTENNFIDNINALVIVGKRTGSDWSLDGRGNFWSGYDGYDLDVDGIGDGPARIQNVFEYLEGKVPNMRVYLYSPASQALASATQAFPIVEINREEDPFPLLKPIRLSSMPAVELCNEIINIRMAGSIAHRWAAYAIPACLVALTGWSYRRLLKRRIS